MKKRLMLIVEDMKIHQEILQDLFKDRFDFEIVCDSKQTMDILEKHYKELAIIILDLQTSSIDGFDFLKLKRENPNFCNIPVIVVTDNDEIDARIKALELGAWDIIATPFNPIIVEKRITNVISLYDANLLVSQLLSQLQQNDAQIQLQFIFDNVETGIVVMEETPERKVIYTNQAYYHLLGVASDKIKKDEKISNYLCKEDKARIMAAFKDYLAGLSHQNIVEFKLQQDNGNIIWVKTRMIIVSYPQHCNRLLVLICNDITELKLKEQTEKALKEEYDYKVVHDELTEIYNRQGFMMKAREFIQNHPQHQFAIVQIDINQFKLINELFGYATGDLVLKNCAASLRDNIDRGVYARSEADVFLLCLFREDLNINKIISYEKEIEKLGLNFAISFTAGIYVVEDVTLTVNEMVNKALLASREAKRKKQKVHYYYDSIKALVVREQEVLLAFEEAIKRKEFEIYLQPIINLFENSIDGAEALVRWNHPTKGLQTPGQFIPILEKNGLIVKLDYYVWDFVFSYLKEREERGLPSIYISLNLSRVHLISNKFVECLLALKEKYNIKASLIKIEVTETAYINNTEVGYASLDELSKNGFSIVIDDFGSGYSSLNTLSDILADVIKMDMKFLRVSKKRKANSIILSIIQMIHNIGLKVVAEGVESQEEKDMLLFFGCDYIQGYYYFKPLKITEFEIVSAEPVKSRGYNLGSTSKMQQDIVQLKKIYNFEGIAAILDCIPNGYAVMEISRDLSRISATHVSDALSYLLGYEPYELKYMSQKIIDYIIHPDDVAEIKRRIGKAINQNGTISIEQRFRQKDGNWCWLEYRAKMVKCDNNLSTWYGVFTNLNKIKIRTGAMQEVTLQENQNNLELLAEVSNTMVYEYDVEKDEINGIIYAGNEKLPYNPKGYLAHIEDNSFLHPDDLQIIKDVFTTLAKEAKNVTVLYRARYINNEYRWYRTYHRSIIDNSGKVVTIIGKAIDCEMEIKFKEQAEKDSLTGLYNQISFANKVTDFLKGPLPTKKTYIIEFDIQNFKKVNKSCGYLVVNEILVKIGDILRSVVSVNSIPARLGGDEFAIFNLAMTSKEDLLSRIETLINEIKKLSSDMNLPHKLNISLGITTYRPGDNFQTMLARVEAMMCQVKTNSQVYDMLANEEEVDK